MRRLLALIAALVLASSLAAQEEAGPVLAVEAPASLAAVADEVRHAGGAPLSSFLELFGLREAGPPIRVVLAEEGSPFLRGVPSFVAGYARGAESLVVLAPARSPSYPDEGLVSVLHHEVAHVLLYRASRGRPVPRWFNEGVAMLAGRSWTLGDDSRLALSAVLGGRTSLYALDRMFDGEAGEVRRAYALSGGLVSDLVDRYGGGLPRALLRRVADGDDFGTALRKTTGRTLLEVDDAFLERQSLFRRWIPILGSSAVLWFAIALLGLAAGRRRRRMERRQRERLAEEEARALASAEGWGEGEGGPVTGPLEPPAEPDEDEEGRASPPPST